MSRHIKNVSDALNLLNWNYGYGDVIAINYRLRTFTIQGPQMKPEKRKFRVFGRTVFALGHQRSIRRWKPG